MQNNQKKAYFFAFITILLWSTSASAFKISLRYTDNIHLLFYSSLSATLVLTLINIMRKDFFKGFILDKKSFVNSLFLGFLNPFLYYFILFKAFELIPAQQAQPLNFIWPLMIVLLSNLILKQALKFTTIVALLISFLGVIIISTKGQFNFGVIENSLGVFLALFSSIVWALFFVFNLKDKRDGLKKLNLSFLMGTIFSLSYLISSGSFHFSSIKGLLGGIYIGIIEMALAFFFWSEALKLSSNSAKVSNLIFLTPFLSMLCISIVVGEKIIEASFIGLLVITCGIILQKLFDSEKKKQ